MKKEDDLKPVQIMEVKLQTYISSTSIATTSGNTRFNNRDIGIMFNIRENHMRSIPHKVLIKKRPPYPPLALELQQEEVV
jgi:hypothetical protein